MNTPPVCYKLGDGVLYEYNDSVSHVGANAKFKTITLTRFPVGSSKVRVFVHATIGATSQEIIFKVNGVVAYTTAQLTGSQNIQDDIVVSDGDVIEVWSGGRVGTPNVTIDTFQIRGTIHAQPASITGTNASF